MCSFLWYNVCNCVLRLLVATDQDYSEMASLSISGEAVLPEDFRNFQHYPVFDRLRSVGMSMYRSTHAFCTPISKARVCFGEHVPLFCVSCFTDLRRRGWASAGSSSPCETSPPSTFRLLLPTQPHHRHRVLSKVTSVSRASFVTTGPSVARPWKTRTMSASSHVKIKNVHIALPPEFCALAASVFQD